MGSEIQKITVAEDVRNLGELYGTRDAYRTEEEYNVDMDETLDSAGQWIALENPALKDEFVAGYIDSFVRFEKGMREADRMRREVGEDAATTLVSHMIADFLDDQTLQFAKVLNSSLELQISRWCVSGGLNIFYAICDEDGNVGNFLGLQQEKTPRELRLERRMLDFDYSSPTQR